MAEAPEQEAPPADQPERVAEALGREAEVAPGADRGEGAAEPLARAAAVAPREERVERPAEALAQEESPRVARGETQGARLAWPRADRAGAPRMMMPACTCP